MTGSQNEDKINSVIFFPKNPVVPPPSLLTTTPIPEHTEVNVPTYARNLPLLEGGNALSFSLNGEDAENFNMAGNFNIFRKLPRSSYY